MEQSDLAETIALIRKRMKSGECDLRDVGQILTGRWDQGVPAAILAAALAPATEAVPDVRGAIADIAAERQRQVDAEGWTAEHDDAHSKGEMALAAAAYSIGVPNLSGSVQFGKRFLPWRKVLWPWALTWWKPTDRRRNLVKAAALIVAEIDRLDRLASSQEGGPAS